MRHRPQLGLAIGLAWTEVGGETLEIEVQTLPGKGKFTITGKLGDVMKESVQTGYTYLRSIGKRYGIPDDLEETTDIHIPVSYTHLATAAMQGVEGEAEEAEAKEEKPKAKAKTKTTKSKTKAKADDAQPEETAVEDKAKDEE